MPARFIPFGTYRLPMIGGPRLLSRPAPHERHFGLSSRSVLEAANDNRPAIVRRLYRLGPVLVSVAAASLLATAL